MSEDIGRQPYEQEEDGSLTVRLLVVPRAKRDSIEGFTEDGFVKIRVAAPPVGGKANKHLIHFIAKTLGLAKKDVEIISGEKTRYKVLRVEGLEPDEFRDKIEQG